MNIGRKDKNGKRYSIWMCGICFYTFYEGSAVVRIVVIVVTFCVYISFVIGKAVVYSKYCK